VKSEDLPYFDFLPDEVLFNLFSMLNEREMGRFAMSCKRFLAYLDVSDIWQSKAINWKNLHTERDRDRKYYVSQFKENEKIEKDAKVRAVEAEKKNRRDQFVRNSLKFYRKTIYNWRVFDIPILCLIIIWTVLMALRDDEFFVCNYHLVFLPLYLGYFYVFVASCLAFPIAEEAQSRAIYDIQYPPTLLSALAKEFTLGSFFFVGGPWLISLLFFILYAIAKESNFIISDGWSFMPLAICATPACFFCCFYCLSHMCRSYRQEEAGIAFMGVVAYLYFVWLFAFLATKSAFYLYTSWAVALTPFWLILCSLTIPYFIGCCVFLCGGGTDRRIFLQLSIFLVPGFFAFVIWMALLCWNLQQIENDDYQLLWIIVDIPVIVMEIIATIGIGYLLHQIEN